MDNSFRHPIAILAVLLIGVAWFTSASLAQDANVIVTVRKPVPLLLNTWRTDPSIVRMSILPSRRIVDAKIKVTIENLRTGDKVTTDVTHPCMPRFTFEANTLSVLFGPQIICTDAFKVDSKLQSSVLAVGSLPEGDYTFCVEILENDRPIGTTGPLCDQFNVTWSDPPATVAPIEGSVIRCPSPIVLTWTPVAPIPAGTTIQYRVRLVGVVENQEPRVAIEVATPAEVVLDGQFNVTTVTILPNDPRIQALLLQRSPRITRFAWQVQAIDVANNRHFETRGATAGKGPLNTFEYHCGDLRSVILTAPGPTQPSEICSAGQPLQLTWQDPTPTTVLAKSDVRYRVAMYPYLDNEGAALTWQQIQARPNYIAESAITSVSVPWWEMTDLLARMRKSSPEYKRLAWVVITMAKNSQTGKHEPTATLDHNLGMSPPWPINYTCTKLSESYITFPKETDSIDVCGPTSANVTLAWTDPTPAALRSGRDIGYQWIIYPFSAVAGARIEADLGTITTRPTRSGTTPLTTATIASSELLYLLAEAQKRGMVNARLAFVVLTCERFSSSQEYKPTGTNNSDVGMSHFSVLSLRCSGLDAPGPTRPEIFDTLSLCSSPNIRLEWEDRTPSSLRNPSTHVYMITAAGMRANEDYRSILSLNSGRPHIEMTSHSQSIDVPMQRMAFLRHEMAMAQPPYTHIVWTVVHGTHPNNVHHAVPTVRADGTPIMAFNNVFAVDSCQPFLTIQPTSPSNWGHVAVCPNDDVVFKWTDPTPASRLSASNIGYHLVVVPYPEDSATAIANPASIVTADHQAMAGTYPSMHAFVPYSASNNGQFEFRPTAEQRRQFEADCKKLPSVRLLGWSVRHIVMPGTVPSTRHPQSSRATVGHWIVPESCTDITGLRLTLPSSGAPVELCPTGSTSFRWEDRTAKDVLQKNNVYYELTIIGTEQRVDETTDATTLWSRYLDFDGGRLPGFRTHIQASTFSGTSREFIVQGADIRRLDSLCRRWPNVINGLVWGVVPLTQTVAPDGSVSYGSPTARVNVSQIEFRGQRLSFCPDAVDTTERNPAHRPILRTPADSTELWCLGPTTLSWEAPLELPSNVASTDELAYRVVLFAKPSSSTTKELVALRPGSTEPSGTVLWDDVVPLTTTSLDISAQFFTMTSIASKLSAPGTDVAWTVYLVSRNRNSRPATITRVWGIGEKPTSVTMGGGQRMKIQLSGGDDAFLLPYRCSGTAMRFVAPAQQQEIQCAEPIELRWTQAISPTSVNGGKPFGYRICVVSLKDDDDPSDVYQQRLTSSSWNPDITIVNRAKQWPDTTFILDSLYLGHHRPTTGSRSFLWAVFPNEEAYDHSVAPMNMPVRDASNGNMPWRMFTLSCTVSPRAPRLLRPELFAPRACEADSLVFEWKGDFTEQTLRARRYAYRVSVFSVGESENVLDVLTGVVQRPSIRRVTTAERLVLSKDSVAAFARSLILSQVPLSKTIVWYVELIHNDSTLPLLQRKGVVTSDGRLGRSPGGTFTLDCFGITPPVLKEPDGGVLACGKDYTFTWSPADGIPTKQQGVVYRYEWLLMPMRPTDEIEDFLRIERVGELTDKLMGPVFLRKLLDVNETSVTVTGEQLDKADVFRRAARYGYTRMAWTVVLHRFEVGDASSTIVARGVKSLQRLTPKPSAMIMDVRCDRSSSFTLLEPRHGAELPCSSSVTFRWTKSQVNSGQDAYYLVMWALRPADSISTRGGIKAGMQTVFEPLMKSQTSFDLTDTSFTLEPSFFVRFKRELGSDFDRIGWTVVVGSFDTTTPGAFVELADRAHGGSGLPMGREFSLECTPKPPRFTAPLANAVADCGGPPLISWKGASNQVGGQQSDATMLTVVALSAGDDEQATLDTAKGNRLITKVLFRHDQTLQYQFTASERARLDSLWFAASPKIVRFAMQLTPVSTTNPSASFVAPNDAKGRSEIQTFTMSCVGKGVRPFILAPSDSASVSCGPGQGVVSWTSAMVSVSNANTRYRLRCVAIPDGVVADDAAMQQPSRLIFEELLPGDTTQYVISEAQRRRCDSMMLSSPIPIARFALQVQIMSTLSGVPQPIATVGDPLGRSPIVTFTWQCKPVSTADCMQVEPATPEFKETIVGSPRVAFSVRIRPDVKPTAIRSVRLRVWSMQSFNEGAATVKARAAVFDAMTMHTQTGAFVFDTDKTNGATILRVNSVNGTAPQQTSFDAQPNTTYLWSADVTYDSMTVRGDGRPCGRSRVTSSDGMFLYRGPDCNTIATVPAPTNRAPFTGVLTVGDTIRVGLFPARLTKVSGSPAALTGEAVVTVPLFRAGVEVTFTGVTVNTQRQVIGGELRGKRATSIPGGADAVDHLAQAFTTDTATMSMWMGLANDAGRLVSGLSPDGAPMTLPIGIDRVVDGVRVVVGVVDVVFRPTGGKLTAGVQIDMPTAGTAARLSLGARDLAFSPEGLAQDFELGLLSPLDVALADTSLRMRVHAKTAGEPVGTYAKIGCKGFEFVEMGASVTFPTSWLLRSATQRVPVTAIVAGRVRASGEFIITGSMGRSVFADAEEFGLDTFMLTMDMSDKDNPPGIVFPADYVGARTNAWRGFHASKLMLQLPDQFKQFDGTRAPALGVQNLIIDRTGLTMQARAVNLMQYPAVNFGDWGASLDTVGIDMANSALTRGMIAGRLKLPVSDSALLYHGVVGRTPGKPGSVSYAFSIGVKDSINMRLWTATATLNRASHLTVMGTTAKPFMLVANLSGNISFLTPESGKGKNIPIELGGIRFEELKVQTHQMPYLSIKAAAFASPPHSMLGPDPQQQREAVGANARRAVGGFPISITKLELATRTNNAGLPSAGIRFGVAVNLQPGNNAISGGTTLSVWGALKRQPDKPVSFEYDETLLDSIGVTADFGAVAIEGYVRLYNADPTYGNGFKGAVRASFAKMVEAEAVAQFGAKNDYRYWYVDANVKIAAGIPVFAGVGIYGFGGGAWYNMRRVVDTTREKELAKPASSDLLSNLAGGVQAPPGAANSAATYIPDNAGGAGAWGLAAMVTLGTHPSPDAFNCDLRLSAGFVGQGIDFINFRGDGWMLAGLMERQKAKIRMWAEIDYNFPTSTFNGNFGVAGDLGIASFSGNMLMHFSPQKWFVKIGDPYAQRVQIQLLKILKVNAYIMAGKDLPPPPPLPKDVLDLVGAVPAAIRPGQLSTGDGFAFGAEADLNTGDLQFLFFYARIRLLLGFDMALLNFGPNATCGDGSPLGDNGWYAMGQLYAMAEAAVGIKVDVGFIQGQFEILSLKAGVALQGGLPKPTWLAGAVGGQYSILGGLIRGRCNFQFKVGDECRLPTESALATATMISSLSPANGAMDVPLWDEPVAVFNLPVFEPFELEEMLDSVETVTRVYRIKLARFDVGREHQANTFTRLNATTNVVNAADGVVATLRPDALYEETTKHRVTITAYGQRFKLGYSSRALNVIRSVNASTAAQVEQWAQQAMAVDSNWENVTYVTGPRKGQRVEQTITNEFTTAQYTDTLSPQEVVTSYPRDRQRNFLAGQCATGDINLVRNRLDLFSQRDPSVVRSWVARFVPLDGGAPLETAVQYAAAAPLLARGQVAGSGSSWNTSGGRIFFGIPQLRPQTTYALQIVRKDSLKNTVPPTTTTTSNQSGMEYMRTDFGSPVVTGGVVSAGNLRVVRGDNSLEVDAGRIPSGFTAARTVGANEHLVYMMVFRTSQYSTLQQKLNALAYSEVGATAPFLNAQQLRATLRGSEGFDVWDVGTQSVVRSGLTYDIGPLVRVSATTMTDNWHTTFANPKIYDELDFLERAWSKRYDIQLRSERERGNTFIQIDNVDAPLSDHEVNISTNTAMARAYEGYRRGAPQAIQSSLSSVSSVRQTATATLAADGTMLSSQQPAQQTLRYTAPVYTPFDFGLLRSIAVQQSQYNQGGTWEQRWRNILNTTYQLPTFGLYTVQYRYVPTACTAYSTPMPIGKAFNYSMWGQR